MLLYVYLHVSYAIVYISTMSDVCIYLSRREEVGGVWSLGDKLFNRFLDLCRTEDMTPRGVTLISPPSGSRREIQWNL